MENSGDRDTILDGRAATSRGSHRGDGGIVDIAEFAMEDVIGIYAPTLDLFSVGGYVKIGRATLWRHKYVAPRVEKVDRSYGFSSTSGLLGGSSDSSDSDSEDETPKKTDGLCFITDAGINGGICTMALEGDASTDSNDETSDDEVDTSAEQRIANLTKIVHKQNKVLAKLKTDYDKTCAELATLKNAASNPAEPDECEECSIHMISLSKLQTKYSFIVDDRDKLYAELNELRSRSNLLGTCVSCPLLKVDLDNALYRVKNFEEHTCPDLPDCLICPTLRSELNVAKSHIVELEKHTCPVLPSCLTCPNFVVENNDLRGKLADLEEENKHLRTILGWCSIREPQIGMTIAQIKRGERFGPGYDLKHVFGEKSGPPVDEKNPPLAKYTGPPPRKGSGVTSDGLLVETSRSTPKKQVWVPKPKHFKGVQNTKPNGDDEIGQDIFEDEKEEDGCDDDDDNDAQPTMQGEPGAQPEQAPSTTLEDGPSPTRTSLMRACSFTDR
ncbi:unnamed protein product [Miscanthus lutarioriparius]|uniref:Uncharacterized protein n=1 Tax=Miscanthus lutarioriparius TaxID=422564 RepID=A0A811NR14_9POAL|nr:unnamed protein product [Miscanthus lutarioriparius]